MYTAPIKGLHCGSETFVQPLNATDYILLRHSAFFENDVADMSALLPHLFIGAPQRNSRRRGIDEDGANAARSSLIGVSPCKNGEQLRSGGVGNVSLGAAQQEIIPVSNGPQ